MKKIRLPLSIAIGCLIVTSFIKVEAYSNNPIFDLERSRNSLLDRRDVLSREYQRLQQQSDDLNRQLYFVQRRIKTVYDDMKQTDNSLVDVEYSLKTARY